MYHYHIRLVEAIMIKMQNCPNFRDHVAMKFMLHAFNMFKTHLLSLRNTMHGISTALHALLAGLDGGVN